MMNSKSLPQHVAVIMDGNGRWAMGRGLPRHHGHREGARAVREAVRGCRKAGVKYLTLYAFSVANWQRPKLEVTALMRLLVRFAVREVNELVQQGISVGVAGRPEDLPAISRRALEQLIERTKPGNAMRVTLALSYGGRQDILRASRQAVVEALAGRLQPGDLSEEWLRQRMSTAGLPDVDLMIRTGGEQRVSDFLLWEGAYSELYFEQALWPDFTEQHLWNALDWYANRERRFGKTSAQVAQSGQ